MLLQDKIVIVSGIGPGLGEELSTLCAQEGAAAVVLAARTASKLDIELTTDVGRCDIDRCTE